MALYEFAIDGTPEQLMAVEEFLAARNIAYYIEPPNPKYITLEQLEAECEGK